MPLLFLLIACVPVLKWDLYLSFESAKELEMVSVSDKIPVEYNLNRENYTINLRLDDRRGRGLWLYVRTRDMNGEPVTISVMPVGGVAKEKRCGAFRLPYPQDNVLDPRGVMVFIWYIHKPGCEMAKIENRILTLNFSVSDRNSRMAWAESIPFEIKKRGIRIEYDAI